MAANTYFHERLNALECFHCLETIELRRSTCADPELLMQIREEYELDHAKCHEFKDAAKARQAREFRKEGARQKLHEDRRRDLKAGRRFA